ncbi:MAG TPA: hypothetical protein VN903_17795 [Polyangia bacterium]|jgi:hypothetical protein|nr:hypothetical protein [Polyangia bacterium]
MSPTRAALITLTSLVCGCGTVVSYTPLQDNAYIVGSRPAESVDVFLTAPPTRPHRDVGLLEAKQESEWSADETKEMLVELRKEAAHHGCDAIFVKSVGSDAQSSPLASGTWAVKAITATCIRYTAADTAVSQAPAPKKD